MSVGFIHEKLRGKVRRLVYGFNLLSVIAYGVLISWGGVVMTQKYYVKEVVYARYFPSPVYIVELCVPVGMIIFTIYSILAFYKFVRVAKGNTG